MDIEIVVDASLKAYIDPLTPDEHAALEQSLLAEGCRDALVLWGNVLVDGHNRYGICRQHGLPFRTVQHERFQSMEDVHLWMIDQHLGRRSVSDFQRGVLALRRREILAARAEAAEAARPAEPPAPTDDAAPWNEGDPPSDAVATPQPKPALNRVELARAARVSQNQIGMIEKIHTQAAPEVVAAVRSGELSINAAAAVASLPVEEQQAAAQAGREELREAARRVRESRRRPKAEPAPQPDRTGSDELATLHARISELESENAALRARLAELEAG